MLRVENLKVGENVPVSFEVKDGECIAIKGPSGSGKSRLLRAIADLDETTGYVFLNGVERNEMTAPSWRKLVRYIAAEPGWWADTPRDTFPDGPDKVSIRNKLIHDLNLEPDLLDRQISQLSTGERQRLAIARALTDAPHVIAFDEPTASLDKTNAAFVEELIRYQVLAGKIVIIVSHDQAQISRLANHTLELEAARNSDTATPTRDA